MPRVVRARTIRLYEILALVNLIAVHLFLQRTRMAPPFLDLIDTLVEYLPQFLYLMAGGMVARGVWAATRGRFRRWVRRLRRWRWWVETLRLIVTIGIVLHAYSFLKVLMPLATSRQADALLWKIDRLLLFGHSPNVLFLELFAHPSSLLFVDWTYEHVFQWSLYLALALGLSAPSNRVRVSLVSAMTWLWVSGGWLYYTLPSLGPAYAFPEVWAAHREALARSTYLQSELMRNFQNVLHTARTGQPRPIAIMYGIAAFPSLHVAFQTYLALWLRRVAPAWGPLAIAAAIVIFVGSVVTGWHYLVDSLAGVAMALIVWALIVPNLDLTRFRGTIHDSGAEAAGAQAPR